MRDGFGEPQEKCIYCDEWFSIYSLTDGVCQSCDIVLTEYNEIMDIMESEEN